MSTRNLFSRFLTTKLPSQVLGLYPPNSLSIVQKCHYCLTCNALKPKFYSSRLFSDLAVAALNSDDAIEEKEHSDEPSYQPIETEIDRLWQKRIYSKSVSQKAGVEQEAVERFELESLLDAYKDRNPHLDEDTCSKIGEYVEKLVVLAYDDRAPPEMSIAEFEEFMRFEQEERSLQSEIDIDGNVYWDEDVDPKSNDSYTVKREKKPRNSVQGYLRFLFKTHWKRINEDTKDQKRKEMFAAEPKRELSRTWIRSFAKCHQRHAKEAGKSKVAAAMRCGIPLVMDMSYDHLMNMHEKRELARQIIGMVDVLKDIPEPFNLHLTSNKESSVVYNYLQKVNCHVTSTEAPFTTVFPRSNLIYLTPDASDDLEDFKPDDIFVIGGLVDKVLRKNCSLVHAEKLGIRCAKFPLSDNARVLASKPINFLEVLTILHRFTYHKDMHRAICEGLSNRRILKPEEATEIVRRQFSKAQRLIGEPNFVNRERARAQRRMEIVERMNKIDTNSMRSLFREPHLIEAWL